MPKFYGPRRYCSSFGFWCGQGKDGAPGSAGQKGNMGEMGVVGHFGKSCGHMTHLRGTTISC